MTTEGNPIDSASAVISCIEAPRIFASFAGKWGKQAAAILGFVLIVAWAAIFASSSYVLLESSRGWDPGRAAAAQPLILRLTFLFTFLLQVATSVATLSVSDFFDTARLLPETSSEGGAAP